ncbi:hypothetical protein [Lonepinella sp. BR2882]|uniref:hypothetical protein n=1 Tax=Lonepinella sp. BR2882 TaxID=3095283 RepID=UPI003F6E350C
MFRFIIFALLSISVGSAHANQIDQLKHQAELGDTNAQTMLGSRYFIGDGVEKDYRLALKWHKSAAEKGMWIRKILWG